jgi:FecR protein
VSAPRFASLASKVLSRVGSDPIPSPDPDDRARTIDAIAVAIAARGRQRRVRQWWGGVAAAASIAAGGFAATKLYVHREAPVAVAPASPSAAPVAAIVAHPVGGSSSVVVSGMQLALDDGRPVAAGSRVVTPADGRATLSFATGSTVLLREGTDMTVGGDGDDQVLRLDAGSIELHVAKVKPGGRFLVDTVDSEVEVRGTRFRVAVVPGDATCGAGARTRVAVTEGVVVVRHGATEDRIAAGEQWPAACTTAPRRATAAASRGSQGPSQGGTTAGDSRLGEQNDLFAAAIAARRRGDASGALAALDRFLASYPASPLAEGATVERMRLLHSTSPERAAAAAREYIARYPGGFARAEAEAILADVP